MFQKTYVGYAGCNTDRKMISGSANVLLSSPPRTQTLNTLIFYRQILSNIWIWGKRYVFNHMVHFIDF